MKDGTTRHYRGLERLYASAPVTKWFGSSIRIDDGRAEVRIPLRPEFFHAAGAVHGCIYFRALDDAAFFAANSKVPDTLVLTVSFHLHFLRPVAEGVLLATGSVLYEGRRLITAESKLHDDQGTLLAAGSGTFSRTTIALTRDLGYGEKGA